MRGVRRWSRSLHRSIGYFFTGTTLLYALSGVVFNHLGDVDLRTRERHVLVHARLDLSNSGDPEAKVRRLIEATESGAEYARHTYYDQDRRIRIDLVGGGVGNVDVATGEGELSFRESVPLLHETSVLHANPHAWWTWYSDVYAGGLLLLSLTAVVMVRGKKGLFGYGGLLILAGFVVPVAIYQLVTP